MTGLDFDKFDWSKAAMGKETKRTFCHFCYANCAMQVDDVEDGRLTAVRGDPDDPITGQSLQSAILLRIAVLTAH